MLIIIKVIVNPIPNTQLPDRFEICSAVAIDFTPEIVGEVVLDKGHVDCVLDVVVAAAPFLVGHEVQAVVNVGNCAGEGRQGEALLRNESAES